MSKLTWRDPVSVSAENQLSCDCRLAWLIRLRRRTASAHVKAALESTVCHMERGAVPARLGGPGREDGFITVPEGEEAPPAQLPVKLVDLKASSGGMGAVSGAWLRDLELGVLSRS